MSQGYAEVITLPGLTDLHVHPRDFAQADKEDFETCTRAALAGGVDTIGAMPNYEPEMEVRPYNLANMQALHRSATGRVYTDVFMWAASQPQYNNVGDLATIQPYAGGIKFYMEPTQGNEESFDPRAFEPAVREWHRIASPTQPIAAHAEDSTIEEAIAMIAGEIGHTLLIPHVNDRFVLDAIIKAKKRGLPVFAEVCPHHLFMTETDATDWRHRMKPPLAAREDQDYLWANLGYIDTIGTDHAPHTKAEKDEADRLNPDGLTGLADKKSYGVPGLDTLLPLLLHEITHGYEGAPRLTFQQLFDKCYRNPRKLVGLPASNPSTVSVETETYVFTDDDVRSKCGWSPYAGRVVTGRVVEVKKSGHTVYLEGVFEPPEGAVLRPAA